MADAPVKKEELVLPNEPIFQTLLKSRESAGDRIIIRDPAAGVDADFDQFLRDVHVTRNSLLATLGQNNGLRAESDIVISSERPYIFTLTPANYEFVVAAISILATGGAYVPFANTVLPQEALYLFRQCQSSILLASEEYASHASKIRDHAVSEGFDVTVLPIATNSTNPPNPNPSSSSPSSAPKEKLFSARLDSTMIPQSHPSFIVFTSGTSGPPKGVVHSRATFAPEGFPEEDPDEEGLELMHRSPHWIAGAVGPIKRLLMGLRQEVINNPGFESSFAAKVWERLKKGDVTHLYCVPPAWKWLMEYYQAEIATKDDKEEYIRGIRNLRVPMTGAAPTSPSLLGFWKGLLGRPLVIKYATTEVGSVGLTSVEGSDHDLPFLIGRAPRCVTAKLSEGDKGELLIKNPVLFSHYLGDPEATKAAFTSDGFYKTGDYARKVGEDYVYEGRASTDFLKYYGYMVPVIELEARMADDIPNVIEAYALPLPDPDTGSRVAALVRFREDYCSDEEKKKEKRDLNYIRRHLLSTGKLAMYKLPTALRVLGPGESVIKTVSGKIARKDAVARFFPYDPESFRLPDEVEILREMEPEPEECGMWDWAGV